MKNILLTNLFFLNYLALQPMTAFAEEFNCAFESQNYFAKGAAEMPASARLVKFKNLKDELLKTVNSENFSESKFVCLDSLYNKQLFEVGQYWADYAKEKNCTDLKSCESKFPEIKKSSTYLKNLDREYKAALAARASDASSNNSNKQSICGVKPADKVAGLQDIRDYKCCGEKNSVNDGVVNKREILGQVGTLYPEDDYGQCLDRIKSSNKTSLSGEFIIDCIGKVFTEAVNTVINNVKSLIKSVVELKSTLSELWNIATDSDYRNQAIYNLVESVKSMAAGATECLNSYEQGKYICKLTGQIIGQIGTGKGGLMLFKFLSGKAGSASKLISEQLAKTNSGKAILENLDKAKKGGQKVVDTYKNKRDQANEKLKGAIAAPLKPLTKSAKALVQKAANGKNAMVEAFNNRMDKFTSDRALKLAKEEFSAKQKIDAPDQQNLKPSSVDIEVKDAKLGQDMKLKLDDDKDLNNFNPNSVSSRNANPTSNTDPTPSRTTFDSNPSPNLGTKPSSLKEKINEKVTDVKDRFSDSVDSRIDAATRKRDLDNLAESRKQAPARQAELKALADRAFGRNLPAKPSIATSDPKAPIVTNAPSASSLPNLQGAGRIEPIINPRTTPNIINSIGSGGRFEPGAKTSNKVETSATPNSNTRPVIQKVRDTDGGMVRGSDELSMTPSNATRSAASEITDYKKGQSFTYQDRNGNKFQGVITQSKLTPGEKAQFRFIRSDQNGKAYLSKWMTQDELNRVNADSPFRDKTRDSIKSSTQDTPPKIDTNTPASPTPNSNTLESVNNRSQKIIDAIKGRDAATNGKSDPGSVKSNQAKTSDGPVNRFDKDRAEEVKKFIELSKQRGKQNRDLNFANTLSMKERHQVAEELIGRKLTDKEKAGLEEAHKTGNYDFDKNSPTTIAKRDILENAGFSRKESAILRGNGIAGKFGDKYNSTQRGYINGIQNDFSKKLSRPISDDEASAIFDDLNARRRSMNGSEISNPNNRREKLRNAGFSEKDTDVILKWDGNTNPKPNLNGSLDDYKQKTAPENITNLDQPNLKPKPSNPNPEVNRLPTADYFNKIESYYDSSEATVLRAIGTKSRPDLMGTLVQMAKRDGFDGADDSSKVIELVESRIDEANKQVAKVKSNLEKEMDPKKKNELEERLKAEKLRCQKWIESYKTLGFTNQSIISQHDKILERNCN